MLAFILVFVAFVFFGVLAYFLLDRYESGVAFGFISTILSAVLGIVAIIMIIQMAIANSGVQGKIAANQQRYDSLVYQLENNMYDNDNELGKKELYNQIQSWNEDLAKGKALQYDIWIGVFWPDMYDQFEYIELK